MQYEIKGAPLPYVEIQLNPGESLKCQGGAMSWMSSGLRMETKGGGLGKMFSKARQGYDLPEVSLSRGDKGSGYLHIPSEKTRRGLLRRRGFHYAEAFGLGSCVCGNRRQR